MAKPPLSTDALTALAEALKALGRANAADTPERMRLHMGRAVVAIDEALQYSQTTAFEVEENKKPYN